MTVCKNYIRNDGQVKYDALITCLIFILARAGFHFTKIDSEFSSKKSFLVAD